jgi:hypothetical protein
MLRRVAHVRTKVTIDFVSTISQNLERALNALIIGSFLNLTYLYSKVN